MVIAQMNKMVIAHMNNCSHELNGNCLMNEMVIAQ